MRKKDPLSAPVLLVQTGNDLGYSRDPTSELPINLAGLAAYCMEKGIEVDVFDFHVHSDQEFAQRLKAPELKILGFSAPTLQIYRSENLAKKAKELRPDVFLLLGGIHSSSLPEATAKKFPVFDAVAYGEG